MVSAQPRPREDHAVHSERLIRHAWEQLEHGDRLQASEKAWGAAAHALKAIAERRGWRNRAHTHNEAIAVHLAKLSGDERIFPLYQAAEMLHRNCCEDWKGEAALRMGSKASLNCCRVSRRPTAESGRIRPPPNTPNAPAPAAARRGAQATWIFPRKRPPGRHSRVGGNPGTCVGRSWRSLYRNRRLRGRAPLIRRGGALSRRLDSRLRGNDGHGDKFPPMRE